MVDFAENFNQYSTSKLPTFRDDFAFHGTQAEADLAWASADVSKNRVNIATDVLDLNILRDNTNDSIVHDLVSTVSDSNWVLRFKLTIDTLNLTAFQTQGFFGLFNGDETAGEETVQSAIGVILTAITGTLTYRLFTSEESIITAGASTTFTHALAVETIYVEIKRNSKTTYEVNLYSDATFTDLIESQQGICSAGTIGLRYIGMKNNASMTVGSSILGSMDNVEFWNEGEQVIFQDDFSTGVGWVPVANDVGGVSVTGGQLTGWGSDGGITREIFYDLVANNGITISDTKWTAEFDFQWTFPSTSNNPGHTPFTLSDSIATTDSFQTSGPATPSVPHPRSISMHITNHNAFNIDRGVQIFVKDTTTSATSSVGGTLLSGIIDLDGFVNTTVFPRLERTSATTYKLSVFTDSARTIHVTGTASGADSPITLTASQIITNTNFIHSSNSSAGGAGRVLTGFIDNLSITGEGEKQIGAREGAVTFEEKFNLRTSEFNDDFVTASNWTTSNSSFLDVNTGTTELDYLVDQTVAQGEAIFHDLGAGNVNDTLWTLRFKFDITNLDASDNTSALEWFFGLSNNTAGADTSQIWIAMYLFQRSTLNEWGTHDGLNTVPDNTSGDVDVTDAPSSGTFYCEIKRTSSTTYTITVYNNSDFTDVNWTDDATVSASVTGLRYIKCFTSNNGVSTGLNTLSGTIDDVEFYNGVSLLTNWITDDSNRLNVDTTNRVLKVTPTFTTLNRTSMVFDLGVGNVDDSNWTLRLRANVLAPVTQGASGNNVNIYFGISDGDETVADNDAGQNAIAIRGVLDTGFNEYRGQSAFNQNLNGAGADFTFTDPIAVETIYWELKRTSLTTYEATRFSDAEYTQIVERLSGTCEAGITDLRFIKFWQSTLGSTDHRQQVDFDCIEFYNNASVARTPVKSTPPDFEDSFWEDNWTDAGTKHEVNTTTRVIDWDSQTDGGISQTTFDLETLFPEGVNPTKWGLRFKFTFGGTVTIGGATSQFAVFLTDAVSGISSESAQDHATWKVQGNVGALLFSGFVDDATQIFTGQQVFMGTNLVPAGGTGYGEMTRNGNLFTWAVYSDPDFTQLLGSGKLSVNETVDTVAVRFLKVGRRDVGASALIFNGTVDKIQFWNGNNPTEHETKWVEVNIV